MAGSIHNPGNAGPSGSSGWQLKYVHTENFPWILQKLGLSLFLSTYQTGQLMIVRADQGKLVTLLRNFEHLMGIALTSSRLALGAKNQIHIFHKGPEELTQIDELAAYDICYLPRLSYITGDIKSHEIAWSNAELWVVNTRFSCLCTVHSDYSFVPRWQPSFIHQLEAGDACHLNGLAMVDQQPRYVSVFGRTTDPRGWQAQRLKGGCLLDIPSSAVVASGFCMPHSPRVDQGYLWLLNSGQGQLVRVEPDGGQTTVVAELPGFTRGLALCDRYAFVGLSQIREKRFFGGLPIEERHQTLQCGVWVVDLITGETAGFIRFEAGVTELFDVQLLPHSPRPNVLGFQKDMLNQVFVLP
jgi:uncharacterized protein (TIGR03032 family)